MFRVTNETEDSKSKFRRLREWSAVLEFYLKELECQKFQDDSKCVFTSARRWFRLKIRTQRCSAERELDPLRNEINFPLSESKQPTRYRQNRCNLLALASCLVYVMQLESTFRRVYLRRRREARSKTPINFGKMQ